MLMRHFAFRGCVLRFTRQRSMGWVFSRDVDDRYVPDLPRVCRNVFLSTTVVGALSQPFQRQSKVRAGLRGGQGYIPYPRCHAFLLTSNDFEWFDTLIVSGHAERNCMPAVFWLVTFQGREVLQASVSSTRSSRCSWLRSWAHKWSLHALHTHA